MGFFGFLKTSATEQKMHSLIVFSLFVLFGLTVSGQEAGCTEGSASYEGSEACCGSPYGVNNSVWDFILLDSKILDLQRKLEELKTTLQNVNDELPMYDDDSVCDGSGTSPEKVQLDMLDGTKMRRTGKEWLSCIKNFREHVIVPLTYEIDPTMKPADVCA